MFILGDSIYFFLIDTQSFQVNVGPLFVQINQHFLFLRLKSNLDCLLLIIHSQVLEAALKDALLLIPLAVPQKL